MQSRNPSTKIDVEQHFGLVHHCVSQYYHPRSDLSREDVVQEGMIGLLEAAQRFDETRGCQFSTYAVPWIRKYVLKAIRHEEPYTYLSSVNEDDMILADAIPDTRPSVEDNVMAHDTEEEVAARLDVLSTLEHYIIIHHYGLLGCEEMSLTAIAQELHKSQTTIQTARLRALAKLRAVYQAREAGETILHQPSLLL